MYDWFESCTSSQTYPGKSSPTQREAACEDIVDDDDDDDDDDDHHQNLVIVIKFSSS